jgi:hypothetical protein
MRRPEPQEYAEYYGNYIARVPDGDIVDTLAAQIDTTTQLLGRLTEAQGNHRYAPGKWNLKEVIGHLSDMERVFQIRALAFARRDPAGLPSVDQDVYAANARFASRPLADVAAEFAVVRRAGIAMFHSFDAPVWDRRGCANNVEFTVRSVAFIIAGHELHHRGVIESRYLG